MSCGLNGRKHTARHHWARLLLLLFLCAAAFLSWAAQAEERFFRVIVAKEAPPVKTPTFQVRQGDAVRVAIESDQAIEVHLHGYDIVTTAAAGQAASLRVEALYSGRFPAEIHGASLEGPLFYLEVLP
jgi:hypothetical protein